jgi:hypothetical protein
MSTDFGVNKLVNGTHTWVPAAAGMPQVAVSGITLAGKKLGSRLLYAATHGRGAYRLRVR